MRVSVVNVVLSCHRSHAPSLLVGLQASGRILRRFPPTVFWPAPRVRSALLELSPTPARPLSESDAASFGAFVIALFTRRRKMLPAALTQAVGRLDAPAARALIESTGIDATLRPQALAPAQALALWTASVS